MTEPKTIYTIGHSDRSTTELLNLLQLNQIRKLIDIRAYPYSKRFPHFSQDALRCSVDEAGIDYHWAGKQLGGMREPSQAESHPGLTDGSMRGFAEYMQTPEFEKAIIHLINLAGKSPTAIMCAEKNAGSCHRSMISDYLTLNNITVRHILDSHTIETHQLNSQVRIECAKLIYDRNVSGNLDLH